MLGAALDWAAAGWAVFPLAPGRKEPLHGKAHKTGYLNPATGAKCQGECGKDGHGAWDGTTDPDKIKRWWRQHPHANIGGQIGDNRLVADVDPKHGGTRPVALPPTREHSTGGPEGGLHLVYKVQAGSAASRIKQNNTGRGGKGVDIKVGGGAYIVLPPSTHPDTGQPYTIANDADEHTLTDEEVTAWLGAEEVPDITKGRVKAQRSKGGVISTLDHLLRNPETEGGRNDWLTRVAGHYAKTYHRQHDLYLTHTTAANRMLQIPLEPAEFDKTIGSIWDSEQNNNNHRSFSEDNGWLRTSGGGQILTQTRVKEEDGAYSYGSAQWSDFDITAQGVVEDADAKRVYDVTIHRKRQADQISTTLDADDLADTRRLNAWLGQFGVSIIPPETQYPKVGTPSARLVRYLEDQHPPQFKVVDHLGWDAEADGFVTHEGVLREDGLHEFDGVKPHPRLRGWAKYKYGVVPEDEARDVLAEVLTFHDETVTAVFGAWWAACLVKPQLAALSSQFPFMALEAASESGKTTGFFSLMFQLNGNTQGQTSPTKAALRDSISANRSGIVWIDDMDDPEHLHELLRQATSEGSVAKKSEDRTGQSVVRLVAPICVSGEGLGLADQKALVDRAVVLHVASPTGRRSVHGDYPQWDDIVALRAKYPEHTGGLTAVAGTLVSLALRNCGTVQDSMRGLRARSGGRFGDKIAILRAGARLLAAIVGDTEGRYAGLVDEWATQQKDDGAENALTKRLVPAALRALDWPTKPMPGEFGRTATCAFVHKEPGKQAEVWFSPALLAEWWKDKQRGQVKSRTETETALTDQARALGLGGTRQSADRKQWRVGGRDGSRVYYWRLTPDLSANVIARSRGGSPEPTQQALPVAAPRVFPQEDTREDTGVLGLPMANQPHQMIAE